MKRKSFNYNLYNVIKYLIPSCGIIFFIIQIIFFFLSDKMHTLWYFYPLVVLGFISICGCIFLLFNPEKTALYGIMGTLYTLLFTFTDMDELNILICYIVSLLTFYSQGFLIKNKKFKLFICLLVLVFIIIVRAVIYKKELLIRLFDLWPYLFALSIIFSSFIHNLVVKEKHKSRTIIDLDEFDELTERQKKLIFSILNNEKYEAFAREQNISLSAIKKDAVTIFRVFNTFDRNTFILKYSSCHFQCNGEIIFLGK